MAEIAVLERTAVVRHGRRLEYFTIAWNALEGLVAVVAGAIAGSISLVGFGIDSFIEVTSGSVLLWRMFVDAEVQRRELNERRALQVVGVCFLFLASYIAYESAMDLWSRRAPEHSIPGIVLACVPLGVLVEFRFMPFKGVYVLARDESVLGSLLDAVPQAFGGGFVFHHVGLAAHCIAYDAGQRLLLAARLRKTHERCEHRRGQHGNCL